MSIAKASKGQPAPPTNETALEKGIEALTTLARLLRLDTDRAVAQSGLSQPMASTLGHLRLLSGPATGSELSRSLGCHMGNLFLSARPTRGSRLRRAHRQRSRSARAPHPAHRQRPADSDSDAREIPGRASLYGAQKFEPAAAGNHDRNDKPPQRGREDRRIALSFSHRHGAGARVCDTRARIMRRRPAVLMQSMTTGARCFAIAFLRNRRKSALRYSRRPHWAAVATRSPRRDCKSLDFPGANRRRVRVYAQEKHERDRYGKHDPA